MVRVLEQETAKGIDTLVTGNQNGKLSGRNDPYGIIDTRQSVGYDKGKEGGGNELSQRGRGWRQPNRTNPGVPNAYAEYLAYKQKVQARQQSLALEQALQQLLEQEQAARAVADPQAFAYNGADGFASSGCETGGAVGVGGTGSLGGIDGGYEIGDSFKQGDLDSSANAESAFPAVGIGETTGQILSEGEGGTKLTEPREPKGSKPKGKYEKSRPGKDGQSIMRQNESADLLANEGYDVEMLPETKGGNGYGKKPDSNPDFLINGEAFDCYSPDGSNIRNIWSTIKQKVSKQADRIILNLDDYNGSIDDLYNQFEKWTIDDLKELLVIKDGKVVRWIP